MVGVVELRRSKIAMTSAKRSQAEGGSVWVVTATPVISLSFQNGVGKSVVVSR